MDTTSLNILLAGYLEPGFILQTRVHALHSYIKCEAGKVFIKREDDLSSGIPGSKFRKFVSLIPYLAQNKYDEVVLIGGANSNNILGALQLLKERKIPASLFILESNLAQPAFNELLIKMLLTDEKIRYLSRLEWPAANKLADKYRAAEELKGRNIFIVREGSAVVEAMPGAMTIAIDILRNEAEKGLKFNHIFIDSGTGTSALGMILAFEILEETQKTIHITLIAGNEAEFLLRLDKFRNEIANHLKIPAFKNRLNIAFHKPVSSISFGSINNTVIKNTLAIAREEGILMEPVYSVKHLMTIKNIIENENPGGKCLVIYNGGTQGLLGFSEKIWEEMN